LAVVVTVAKGYDLGYIWKTQGEAAGRAAACYYLNTAQAGEPPGRWWGPGAQALGPSPRQIVQRKPYEAVYQQIDPRTGARPGRSRGCYPTFADHVARLAAAEPHATAERLIELEREAAQATRQPAAYTDVTVSFCDGAARSCFHTQASLSRSVIGSASSPGGGSKQLPAESAPLTGREPGSPIAHRLTILLLRPLVLSGRCSFARR